MESVQQGLQAIVDSLHKFSETLYNQAMAQQEAQESL